MNKIGQSTLEKLKLKLRVKNYSERTIDNYIGYIEKYINYYGKETFSLTLSDLESYLLNFNYSSVSQQNQIINSLKLFYKYSLSKSDIHLNKIERPRSEQKLPIPLSEQEVKLMFDNCKNIKHKAILGLLFFSGLRVSEVLDLKPQNIDRQNMVIHIKQSKGNKDRSVPLDQNLLSLLEKYYREYKPKEFMFNGQFDLQYSASSINQFMKEIAIKAKIKKNVHSHIGRHSCFLKCWLTARICQLFKELQVIPTLNQP